MISEGPGDAAASEADVEDLCRRLDEFDLSLSDKERLALRAIVEANAPPLDRIRRRGESGLLSLEEKGLLDQLARDSQLDPDTVPPGEPTI